MRELFSYGAGTIEDALPPDFTPADPDALLKAMEAAERVVQDQLRAVVADEKTGMPKLQQLLSDPSWNRGLLSRQASDQASPAMAIAGWSPAARKTLLPLLLHPRVRSWDPKALQMLLQGADGAGPLELQPHDLEPLDLKYFRQAVAPVLRHLPSEDARAQALHALASEWQGEDHLSSIIPTLDQPLELLRRMIPLGLTPALQGALRNLKPGDCMQLLQMTDTDGKSMLEHVADGGLHVLSEVMGGDTGILRRHDGPQYRALLELAANASDPDPLHMTLVASCTTPQNLPEGLHPRPQEHPAAPHLQRLLAAKLAQDPTSSDPAPTSNMLHAAQRAGIRLDTRALLEAMERRGPHGSGGDNR